MELNLTEGSILKKLTKLALPIMATSFFQMAYNMTDMMWLGRVGSSVVAAVGVAGFFIWFANAIVMMTKVGAEVTVSQAIGAKNKKKAFEYIVSSLLLAFILGVFYSVFIYFFANNLISIFQFEDKSIFSMAVTYLRIISFGTLFTFLNPTFSGVYNGLGNSKIPFLVNGVGLIVNMVLDPILILNFNLKETGAAIATVFSQLIVLIVFLIDFKKFKKSLLFKFDLNTFKKIIKIGFPITLNSSLFATFSMIISTMISKYGALPVAVQSVGAKIESVSWMTASGFSTALGTFTGQNYGAGKINRIKKGYLSTITLSFVVGLFATFAFMVFGRQIFSFFIPEQGAIDLGYKYLKILAISQVFMTLEISTQGAFNGFGKTIPPTVVSILFTGLRIPFGVLLTEYITKDVTGFWWSISISSIIKGVVLTTWFVLFFSSKYNKNIFNSEEI